MSPLILRQLWSLVEDTQTQVLLSLDDTSLVQCLLKQLTQKRAVSSDEADYYKGYIHSRLPLIRDLAQGRMSASIGT